MGGLIAEIMLTELRFTWVEGSVLASVTCALLLGFVAWVAFIVQRSNAQGSPFEKVLHVIQEQLDRFLDHIDEPPTEARLRRRVKVGTALAVLLIGLMGVVSWRMARRATEDTDWVVHTHEVSTVLDLTLRHLVDVETGGRGFALTGSQDFLEPMDAGSAQLGHDLQRLRLLIGDDPGQRRRLSLLSQQVEARVKASEGMVAGRRYSATLPTLQQLERGKQIMNAARLSVQQMEAEETRLLEQRIRHTRVARQFASSMIGLGSLLGMIFLSIAGFTINREIGASARSRAQMRSLNADLEQRVEQRTAKLTLTQAELRTSEEMFRLLLDGIKDYAVYMLDPEGRVVSWNSGAASIKGYRAEEIVGQNFSRFFTQADRDDNRPRELLGKAASAGRIEGQGWRVRKDGSKFWANFILTALHESNGDLRGYSKIVRDITERRQAEIALSESEGRLAGVLDSAMDAIITVDEQQCILLFNRAAEQMFHCPGSEAMGRPITRFIPQRFHAGHPDHIRRFGRTGVTNRAMGSRNVLWALREDGQEFQIEASISQVITGGKKLFTVILRDITERKQAEEVRERLAAVVDWSDDAIISETLDGKIVAWNRGAEKVFGYSASEIVGKSMLVLLPLDRIAEELDILTRIRGGESLEHFETVRVRNDGRKIDVSVTISPIRDSSGAICGASKIARDITERKRGEAALRDKELLLSESQRIAHIGSWTCDPKDPMGKLIWSDELYRLYGLSPSSFTPTINELLNLIIVEDRSAVKKWMVACAAGEKPGDLEFRLMLPDGKVRLFCRRGELQYDHENKPIRMSGTSQDITERRQAEDALRESEERFQAMVNGIPQLAWMAKPDGSIFWYNQRWYDYTGTTPETMQGWGWQSVHDPDILSQVLEKWNSAVGAGNPFDMEFPLRGADGRFRAFLNRCLPLKDSSGRVVRWFGTNTDISERKDAENRLAAQAAELAQSRQTLEQQTLMLKLVLGSMGEGLVVSDTEGRILIWNDSATKLLGREGAVTGLSTLDYRIFLPDGITPHPPDLLPMVRTLRGESVQTELMILRPEMTAGMYLDVSGRPLKDAQGKLFGGVLAFRDISEHKRTSAALAQQAEELSRQATELLHSQQALETQTRMLQSVLDSMVEGLVAADEQGKFILWNPAAEKIVGLGAVNLPPDQWGKHYGIYFPDTVTPIPAGQTPLERAIRGEVISTEIFLRNPGLNRDVWLELNSAPLRGKDGMLCGGVTAFRDITRRKADELEIRKLNEQLEERIAKRTAQLQAANNELEAFSYSISHDLRAPLRHIGGFARILVHQFGPAMAVEAREYLQHIEDAVRRMGLLVDALLGLARLGGQSLRLRHTEINPIVDQVITVLQPECEGRDVQWRVAQLPPLDCDQILMGQVLQNLLGNALKYSRGRASAVIEVDSIQEPGRPAVLFVRDNGAGFDMKYAQKLFGVFQRMHTESEFEGTGVGLATVQRIIQKHGGAIWAEAEVDQGATFYFTVAENGNGGSTP